MTKRSFLLILTIFVTMFVFGACSKTIDTGDSSTNSPVENKVYTYPFTGLETTEKPSNRAVAVMVNNHQKARPQSGLHEADIVFELLAEGSVTRFLALYQSTLPERVGPVRSAREYYFHLADAYDALYVYHGAASFINRQIETEEIDFLNGATSDNDQELFLRESFRVAPHNSYLLFDEVYNRAQSKQYEIERDHHVLPFLEDGEAVTGNEVSHIKITYFANESIVEYKYDADSEKYIRISDGEQTVDLETEIPIELDNIFVIEADHEVVDDEGRRAIDLESGGFGYLFQKGKSQQVEWKNDKGYLIPIKDQEPVPFVPGKTWVNVVQTNPPNDITQVDLIENDE